MGSPVTRDRDRDEDWRARLDAVDAAIIDGYQSGFPITHRPFRTVGDALDITETDALQRVSQLLDTNIFRRFGAVLNPPVIGASTLAAIQAPDDEFDALAAIINDYRQVNHNYRRDHAWNMWFVITAGSLDTRNSILRDIEDRTGCAVLNLPMVTDYYIDLEFPVVNRDRFARPSTTTTPVTATRIPETAAANLSPLDRDVLLEIQNGFPLTPTPYDDIATAIKEPRETVIAAIDNLAANGCIKRIGCVVNHVTTGFDANCMVVWDVPDDDRDACGEAAGARPEVTLSYHRPRRPDHDWPYNLFTMIHGRDTDAVDTQIDALATDIIPYDHERLYSTTTLKQTGAHYADIITT